MELAISLLPGKHLEHSLWVDVNVEGAEVVFTVKNKKAPGPDGILTEVYKLVFHQRSYLLLRAFSIWLNGGKGKEDHEQPSVYRPLCMLDMAGKVFEKLIRTGLSEVIRAARDLSPRQFGSRSGRSTVDVQSPISMPGIPSIP